MAQTTESVTSTLPTEVTFRSEDASVLKKAAKHLRAVAAQPALPGWEAYPITKREVATSGKGALDPEWESHEAFMAFLAGKWGREFSTFGAFADEDGVKHSVEFVYLVGSERNDYDEVNDGPSGRIHRIGLKLTEIKVEDA